jgi:DNA-binding MarR family transcriptional regulator
VVARLVRARLIERRTAAGDARRAELSLTARGHSRLRSAPRTAQERLVAMVDRLPARERIRLAATLERLVDGMGLAKQRPAAMFDETATRKKRAGRFDA